MILVTGATGKLGRLVVEELLAKVPSSQIAAGVRGPEKAKDLAARGVEVRRVDYDAPETLEAALRGVDRLLLISSSEVGRRVGQHEAVVEAARKAGVGLLVYTSILHADRSRMALAAEHKATEEIIRASGLRFVFNRHGWYTENYTDNLAPALEHGVILGSAGGGRVAPATRRDFAGAAAAVLAGSGHEGKIYELAGDTGFTLAELAAEISQQSGKTVAYKDLPAEEYAAALVSLGVPRPFADILADSDLGIARGELNDESGDLRRLLGRPTTSLADAVAAALERR